MRVIVIAAVLLSFIAGTAFAGTVKVMSRNLYLGADLSAGTSATSVQELVDGAGQILNQVDANRFDIRAEGLAREILKKKPHLVGLQEVALWRDAPCTDNPLLFTATQVHPAGDFLALLLDHLNKNGKRIRYNVVIAEPEFDFQVWANTDGDAGTSGAGCPFGSEIEGRLTMRDVILVRNKKRIVTADPDGGHYDTLLQVTPGGLPIDVTRGWTRVTAQVGHLQPFTFVNTHLEAFDNNATNPTNQGTSVGNGEVRLAQAEELIAPGGPATGAQPVILVGDLNSDTETPLKAGDELADQALLDAGFVERSTYDPLGCCLAADVLTEDGGGDVSQFDHKVDHIMTNAPATVTLKRSKVSGLEPRNGFWDSDHAGIFSALRLPH
jgi:hypothetical protein